MGIDNGQVYGQSTVRENYVVSENELIRLMANGDVDAFAELYDQFAPRVLGLLARWLPTRTDADDVLQEVFLQAWNKASKFDPARGTPKVWLMLMARSRAMDWLRRQKRTSPQTEEHEPVDLTPPEAELERVEVAASVQSALAQLPEEQRQVIQMSFFDGFAHQQIAEELDIPLGTAKTRIRLGMRRLRGVLAPTHCTTDGRTR